MTIHQKSTLLLFLLTGAFPSVPASEPQSNELVISNGIEIRAKTTNGEIQVKAGKGLIRNYTWEGATRTADLWPRKSRWYGSYGAYFPGPGLHWKEHKGIKRGVVEEGQQNFNTLEEAIAWLKLPYYSDCVYRDDGLVVCFSKNTRRYQINVSVWQIFIEGSKPYIPPESAGDRIWFYDPKEKPKIFSDSQNKTYYIGGKKPTKIPGSCNECISIGKGS